MNNDIAPNRLRELIETYNEKIEESINYGCHLAESEKKYRIELSKFLAEKILDGHKVTVLGDLARGEPKIAELREDRDKYKILYESNQERIFALRTEIRVTETEMKLEYQRRD